MEVDKTTTSPQSEAAPEEPQASGAPDPTPATPPAAHETAAPPEVPPEASQETPPEAAAPPQPAAPLTDTNAALEQEIAQALGDQSIEQLMEQNAPPVEAPAPAPSADAAPKEFHAEMKRGRIAAIRGEDVFVELTGEGKLQGVVPASQFDRSPRIGSIMDFVVDHVDEGQGLMYLSREGAVSRSTWEQLQQGAIVDARVVSTNKGGLELEMIGGIRAFMPASQVDTHHVKDLEAFVGQKIEGAVQQIDRKSKKVVLSRRQVLERRRAESRAKLMAELEVGQVRDGVVSSVVDFGAFVDLGGVDGLVHVTDLSYTHVNKPAEVVKAGQPVKVKVLKIDPEKDRISLGMKQVEPDPWDHAAEKYKVGDQVGGRIIRTANFGAFVELEPGVEGLLPLSEMSWQRIHKAEEVVKVGDTVRMQVLSIEPAKHRLSLSLKQAAGDPWVGAEVKYAKDSMVEATVKSITDFGAFVELEPGIEGLVHISEMSDRRIGRVEEVLSVGDVKQFRVIEISEDNRKVKLSLKSPGAAAGGGRDAHDAQGPAKSSLPRKARHQKQGALKSGLGDVGNKGGGMGLGSLSLDDFK